MNDAVPIRITGLTKTFAGGAGITDVDLVVQAGQVFGLSLIHISEPTRPY